MESRNGSNTLRLFLEGSGSHITTSPSLERNIVHRNSSIEKFTTSSTSTEQTSSVMNSDLPSLEDIMGDNTMLLQTNILLTAVLVVCFVTFASVIAICVCFLRRYCRNRRASHPDGERYHTTLVSKATSITGLHAPDHEYYSTKIEKSNDDSPINDQINKSTVCELDQGRNVKSTSDIFSPEFNRASPMSPEQAAPIYFRIKNALTSTPNSANCVKDIVDNGTSSCTECGIDSQSGKRNNMVYSVATTPSIYTSAFSDHRSTGMKQNSGSNLGNHDPTDLDEGTDRIQVRCMTKGPQTQSVSWFVPLNGFQREPLRHSVVDLSDEEVEIDDAESTTRVPPIPAKKYRKCRRPYDAPLNEEDENKKSLKNKPDLVLCDIEQQAPSEAPTMLAENIPLMVNKENYLCENVRDEIAVDESSHLKRSRLKSVLSENGDRGDNEVCARSRSLSSPDEKTMWKQREERPVLFLGADSK